MKTTTPNTDRIQTAFKVVALASLRNNNKSTSSNDIAIESARIERCADWFYKTDKSEVEYSDYIINFLKTNLADLIKGTKFSGLYLDDVQDGSESELSSYNVVVSGWDN